MKIFFKNVIILFLVIVFYNQAAFAQVITTFAGGGIGLGDNIPATSAKIILPSSGAFDAVGNYYFVEGVGSHKIRKISTAGIITTVAGTGIPGYSGDEGPATAAELNYPTGVAVDISGNIYIADWYNHNIRKIDAAGIIHTIAGNGIAAFAGDGGPATQASLTPMGLCVDAAGNLFLIDTTARIRKINSTGTINTIAGTGVYGYSGEGGPATAAEISPTYGICLDAMNNLYFSCAYRVQKISMATNIINTIAGTGNYLFNGDNIQATDANLTAYIICIAASGELYIGDVSNERVRMIDMLGVIHTVAGNGIIGYTSDGGLADTTEIHNPEGLVIDTCGNLYIADEANYRIRKVSFNPNCFPENVNILTNETFSIYPNPAYKEITIESPATINIITLYDMLGRTLITEQNDKQKIVLDIESLASGVYFVKVNNEKVQKIVKE